MKIGDVVEIHELRQGESDAWRGAVVVALVGTTAFTAQLLKGDFGHGFKQKTFPLNERYRQWR